MLRFILQFSLMMAVIGVLVSGLIDRLRYAQEQSEKTFMEATIQNMNSGVKIEAAMRSLHGKEATIFELVGGNPTQWLETQPTGYTGSCGAQRVEGEWCFDGVSHEIVYKPKLDQYLTYRSPDKHELRWRVTSAAEIAGTKRNGVMVTGEIKIVSTTPFSWF